MLRVFLPVLFLLLQACAPRVELKSYELGTNQQLLSADGTVQALYSVFKPVTLLFIGYTSCPDFCPMTLSKVSRSLKGFSEEQQAQVQTVFVSIDPEIDSPAKLQSYTSSFSFPLAGFVTLPGTTDTFLRSWGAYRQFRDIPDSKARIIDHSTYVYVLDKDRKVRYLLKKADSPEKIAAVIKQVMVETAS